MDSSFYIIPIDFATPSFDEALALRDLVLRKPINLKFFVKDIVLEYDSIHLGYYSYSADLLGVLVLKPISKSVVKMRQVAIHPDYQSKGIGKQLVIHSEKVAKELGYKKMELHARDTAIPFYKKLKYATIGKPFEEVSIKHYKMEKAL